MINIFKNIGILLLTIISSFFIFIIFLRIMEYPGGSVGMAPILLLYAAVISLIPAIVTLALLRIKRTVKTYEAILIFSIAFSLVSFFYLNIQPFDGNTSEMFRNVNQWVYISEFISCGLVVMFNTIRKTLLNKIEKTGAARASKIKSLAQAKGVKRGDDFLHKL